MKWKWTKTTALVAALAVAGSLPVLAAGFFTNGVPVAGTAGTTAAGTLPLTGNETLPADTNLAAGATPQSEAITVSQLSQAMAQYATQRNYIDNGAMAVDQQGTGIITCGTSTAPTNIMFAADRFLCDTNVVSGAGRNQITTTVPAPPAGFQQSLRVYRNSGALLQQVCSMQEIESGRSVQLQGRPVVLSMYLQALAGMSGLGQVNVYVITGTGTDQGFGTLTASPAITPAWTGIAGGTTPAGTFQLATATPAWARFYAPAVVIPAAATEVGIEICFTPGATGAGTTDGFAVTGVQLEEVTQAAGAAPSSYEFRPLQQDLLEAERFFWQLNEPAALTPVGVCQVTVTSTTAVCQVMFPTQMRGTTPVITIPTTGTFKELLVATQTTWVTPTASTCSVIGCDIVTSPAAGTAGQAALLSGGGGSGIIQVISDVVM